MNTVMKRVRSDANMHMLIQVGVLLSSVVFLTYYSSSTYLHIIPAQILLGISWSMLYLGSLYILLRNNDGERASSTALLESYMSISIIIGSLIGGIVAEFAGLRSVMLLSSLLCFASFVIAVNDWRRGSMRITMLQNIRHNLSNRYARMLRQLTS
jgi:predicted MFS family arabinose efflux permease